MSAQDIKKEWTDYCHQEIEALRPLLATLSFELADEQVHIGGERYVAGEKKLVLVGKRVKDSLKVIIKVSSDPKGIAEIKRERQSQQMLKKIKFAYHVFFTPQEILYQETDGRVIFITKYIEQECQFLERDIKNQFFLALKGLEVQEGVQATTYEHAHDISKYFGIWQATDYLKKFDEYHRVVKNILVDNAEVLALFDQAKMFLEKKKEVVDLYSGFLTHWDFVPHNLRIQNNDIYLLDHSSIRFGDKHESWARFINFMCLYNPELAKNLLFYVEKNRPASEYLSLQAMRVFRLAEIIWHYANTLERADSQLLTLNKARIKFWSKLLQAVLDGRGLDNSVVEDYKKLRDSLRSVEEKKRQEKLH
ncbi:MAG: hypothetical protein WC465_03935 [Patescibacteria group bacterium]